MAYLTSITIKDCPCGVIHVLKSPDFSIEAEMGYGCCEMCSDYAELETKYTCPTTGEKHPFYMYG